MKSQIAMRAPALVGGLCVIPTQFCLPPERESGSGDSQSSLGQDTSTHEELVEEEEEEP
jgi:hypothetical protein